MKTIYKCPLQITYSQAVELPIYSEILCIQMQKDIPCLWAIVDTDQKEKVQVQVTMIGTGHKFYDPDNTLRYCGTLQIKGLVFHAFLLLDTQHKFTIRIV